MVFAALKMDSFEEANNNSQAKRTSAFPEIFAKVLLEIFVEGDFERHEPSAPV